MRLDQAGHFAQHTIADLMSMTIVVVLEVVDIDQGQGQWLAAAACRVAFLLQRLFEAQAVASPVSASRLA